MKKCLAVITMLILSLYAFAGGPQGDIEACLDRCIGGCEAYAENLDRFDQTLYLATCRSNCILQCYSAWLDSAED